MTTPTVAMASQNHESPRDRHGCYGDRVTLIHTRVMSRQDLEALGAQRESLSTNPLLMQPELGKPRRRCFTLPPGEFTYGMRSSRLDGGAAEALSSWYVQPTRPAVKKHPPERDFLALNKLAAQSGLTTAHEQTQFRATHDILLKEKEPVSRSRQKIDENMTFGITTRPCTPIFELLENRYGERWLGEQKRLQRLRLQKMTYQKQTRRNVYETKASLLRRHTEPVDQPRPWHMDRFSRIPAQLHTFQNEKQRTQAFMNHASDSAARSGMFGHGVYLTA